MSDNRYELYPNRKKLKTYSHLQDAKKMPSEYELTSNNMIYYVQKGGFEVTTPISAWYEKYQKPSLKLAQWDKFNDPQQTTYFKYIKAQRNKEIYLQKSLSHMDVDYYTYLSKEWINILNNFLAPLRYPWHGLQMIASYIGSMAPESKIAIAFGFQSMDEMHRIQLLAYRMGQLQKWDLAFGSASLNHWQDKPEWQNLRKCIEYLLVTYDWLQAFIALNLVLKPMLDYLILRCFPFKALENSDPELQILLHAFWEDSIWQQQWSLSLTNLILEKKTNKKIITTGIEKWLPLTLNAVNSLLPLFAGETNIRTKISQFYTEYLNNINCEVKLPW